MSTVDFSSHVVNPAATGPAQAPASAVSDSSESGFSFDDLIDIVNPLQHIPVVSTLYRAITGDTIKTFPKIAGDTLYGGVEGFASSMADTIFTKITGKSVGDTVLGWVEDAFSPASTPVASNPAAATPAAASAAAPSGESLGGRVLDWIEHVFSPSDTDSVAAASSASAPAVLPAPAAAPASAMLQVPVAALDTSDAIVVPGQDALLLSLSRNGIGQDVALRAADAYRRTLNVAGTAAAGALH